MEPVFPASIREAVECGLSERFGVSVRVAEVQNIWPSQVFRCLLDVWKPASNAVPGTVIVRLPRDGVARSGSDPLDCERAALQHLTAVGTTLAPLYLAGGSEARFLASEDLGTAPSLLDLLLGKDPEAATQGALSFAQSLGLLHAQTFQGEPRTANQANLPHARKPIQERWEQVKASAAQLGLPTPQGVDQDIAEIIKTLADTSAYFALSSGDPSVVNCKVINGSVRFFDFETACLRHALVDAAVLHFFYPTGGPAWRLSDGMALQIESVYRTELARVCPAATEDASFCGGIAAAGAAWIILRMARLPLVDAGPDRDTWQLLPPDWSGPIPTRSRRRQLVSIIETWISLASRANALGALSTWCERITGALRDRWPEAREELPFYPAFK